MSKRRAVVLAVVVEGLSQAEAARRYEVSRSFVSRLLARYRTEGETAFEPRSRRPLRSPSAIDAGVVERIVNPEAHVGRFRAFLGFGCDESRGAIGEAPVGEIGLPALVGQLRLARDGRWVSGDDANRVQINAGDAHMLDGGSSMPRAVTPECRR